MTQLLLKVFATSGRHSLFPFELGFNAFFVRHYDEIFKNLLLFANATILCPREC